MADTQKHPQSVLFCCDHNAVRSPMAEGLMKKLYGSDIYVQSAGIKHDLEVDGFTIAVCAEMGAELDRHRVRSFDEMEALGDHLSGFDLVIALSAASEARVRELTRIYSLEVDYWPISDPTVQEGGREARLEAFRSVRDDIIARLALRFGPPKLS